MIKNKLLLPSWSITAKLFPEARTYSIGDYKSWLRVKKQRVCWWVLLLL